jgi:hypothetical protein
MLHAFGCYTGSAFHDIAGQVHLLHDSFNSFTDMVQAEEESPLKPEMIGQSDTLSKKDLKSEVPKNVTKPLQPVKMDRILVYPVGRHLAFRSLSSNLMKFLVLPIQTKEIQAVAFSKSRKVVAVGIKTWEMEQFDQQDLMVLFFQIEEGLFFKLVPDSTLKLTRCYTNKDPIPQESRMHLPDEPKLTISKYSSTQSIPGDETFFDRFISSMAFSSDDKNFVVSIRNGE